MLADRLSADIIKTTIEELKISSGANVRCTPKVKPSVNLKPSVINTKASPVDSKSSTSDTFVKTESLDSNVESNISSSSSHRVSTISTCSYLSTSSIPSSISASSESIADVLPVPSIKMMKTKASISRASSDSSKDEPDHTQPGARTKGLTRRSDGNLYPRRSGKDSLLTPASIDGGSSSSSFSERPPNEDTQSLLSMTDLESLDDMDNEQRYSRARLMASSKESSITSQESQDGGGALSYHRYYHVFHEGELDHLIEKYIHNLHIVSSYYDHANWCIIAEKVHVWTI